MNYGYFIIPINLYETTLLSIVNMPRLDTGNIIRPFTNYQSGPHCTNNFSIAIQIRWNFHSAVTQDIMQWLLYNFAHSTTAVFSWQGQNVVAMWYLKGELHWTKLLSNLTQNDIPSRNRHQKIISSINLSFSRVTLGLKALNLYISKIVYVLSSIWLPT